ncbi:MAG: ABC transporter ATP-binding protein [Coriobacteriia bacterium]
MTAAVECTGLVKTFKGFRALDRVDLRVEQGSVFGFLGPNGAGKTTTLRILTGLARATSGRVRVFGRDVARAGNESRAEIGFLPDVPGFYEWMSAEEFLRFAGSLFGLRGKTLDDRVGSLLDLAGLADVSTRVGGFSRGMKQRLGIAQALINAPRLLMLDEPTSALDPIGRKEVLEMVAALRGRTTVFFSTHILADVERVCDTVAVLDRGRVVACAPMDELRARHGQRHITLEVDGDVERVVADLRAQAWASSVEVDASGSLHLTVTDLEAAQRGLPAVLAAAGVGIVSLESGEVSLEEVFVDLVGERSR